MNDVFATELLLVADGSPEHPSAPTANEPMYTIGDLAKRFGLTLTAIRQLIVDGGEGQTLRLSHEACMAQIAILEGKLAEIEAALTELRAMCGLAGDRQRDRR